MKKNRFLKKTTIILCVFIIASTISSIARTVEFPLIQSMVYTPYSDNSLLEKGKLSLAIDSSYSNIYRFNHNRTILNDMEVFSGIFSARYGLTKRGAIEMYYRHTWILGGRLDKLIEDFHKLFNFPDNERWVYPRNSVHYRYRNYFNYTGGQGSSSHLVVAYLKEFYSASCFSVKARVGLGIPLSNKPGLSSGKPFLSTGIIARYKTGIFSIELSNVVTFFKKPSWLNGEDIHTTLLHTRIEANLTRVIAGFNFNTSPFKQDQLSPNAYQVYIGYKIFKCLDFIILEDFAPFNTTPDLSFNIRIKAL